MNPLGEIAAEPDAFRHSHVRRRLFMGKITVLVLEKVYPVGLALSRGNRE